MKTILSIIIMIFFSCINYSEKGGIDHKDPIPISYEKWDSLINSAKFIPRDSLKALFGITYHMSQDSVWNSIQYYFKGSNIACEKGLVKVYDYNFNKYQTIISMICYFNDQNQLIRQIIFFRPDTINESFNEEYYNDFLESFLINQFGEKRYIVDSDQNRINWFDSKREVSFNKYYKGHIMVTVFFQWGGPEDLGSNNLKCK